MELQPTQNAKVDPPLREALRLAQGDEPLRVILFLQPPQSSVPGGEFEIDPREFPSRIEYRKALIERQQRRQQLANKTTLDTLEQLDLRPRGGQMSTAVLIEGRASQVMAALDLPGVAHASLDQVMPGVRPRRRHPSSPH